MSTKRVFIHLVIFLIFIITQQTIRADASLVVNATTDEDGTGTACSLREAITAANTDANYGGCVGGGAYGNDTITFDASVFGTSRTITLSSNLPNITTNMTIVGPGADLLTVSGATLYRPFHITNAATVSLSGLKVTEGYALSGGNLQVESGLVTLTNMIISYGQAWLFSGGGIFNAGTLTIQNSMISNNSAAQAGGGISNIDGGVLIVHNTTFGNNVAALNGGGIFNLNYHVTIQGSTFNNNSAQDGGGLASFDLAIVSNSTFSGNTATTQGGGIAAYGPIGLINSTLSDNAAPSAGGLYVHYNMDVYNSIIANSSSGGDCVRDDGTFNTHNSLIEDGGCGLTNGVNGNLTGDPLLQTLADNGGPTLTRALSASSPAINAGDNSYLSEATIGIDFNADGDNSDTLDSDQRAAARVTNSTLDMGAFEYGSSAPLSLIVDTTADSNLTDCTDLPNDCSLRGAINLANIKIGAQLITFDASVFGTSQTITLSSNLPNITTNMTIVGPGAELLTVSGANSYQPFYITNAATVSLSDLTVTQGQAVAGGNLEVEGAVVSLYRLIISHGQAFNGAGLFNRGTLSIQDSMITDNVALEAGGGITNLDGVLVVRNSTFSNNRSNENGGGIFNQAGHVTVQGSTFNNNTALDGGGLASNDLAIVSNSTFSGNSATRRGGGIATYSYRLELISSTVSGNSAPTAGNLYVHSNMDMYNSILANSSSGGDCTNESGTFNVQNSLIEDGSCGVTTGVDGNLIGDPLLQALADNGGPTLTMALSASSPAINAGDNSYLNGANLNVDYSDFNGDGVPNDTLDTDQRGAGYPRIYFDIVDMGAFEAPPAAWDDDVPVLNYALTSSVTLTWGGVSWATGYEVQISTSSTFDSLECGSTLTTGASELSLTTCSLPSGSHYWRVRAVPSSGTSEWSQVVTIAIAGP